MKNKNLFSRLAQSNAAKIGAVVAVGVLTSTSASAADWAPVTAAIDLAGEITAVQAIVGVLAGLAVVMLGGRKVLSMFGGK